ncbi:MAG: D-aminoacyl-tRNA deacylase [Erysipelotrichaceae bacterium]|nr:D-aminoacyl-tRNA deacylase [Erysipelotrichaceae bacterium]
MPLFELFNERLRGFGINVKTGTFGAHMEVSLVNDGPVTFMINHK